MRPPNRYQPFYCEENAWFVAAGALDRGVEAWVILVTNRARSVAMFSQRPGQERGEPTVWDYHVFVCGRDEDQRLVHWDLDSIVPFGASLKRWWRATFPNVEGLSDEHQPCFRAVPIEEYLSCFGSDRSHMLDEKGNWREPPPYWEPIGGGHNKHYLRNLLESRPIYESPWFDHETFVERTQSDRGFDDIGQDCDRESTG